ncbi:hypothetical protein EC991_009282, partial [Linnemannia zychae]
RAGINFSGEDLRGIRIPGADLSSGQFDSAQFQGADLRKVNFSKCWLRRADMSEAYMEGVQFGELPYLEMDGDVYSCAYSPDGKMLGVGLSNGIMTRKHRLEGHSDGVYSIVFSQDNQRLVSGGSDRTVRLWDTASGGQLLVMEGHTGAIFSVAISPCGDRIASAGDDETVRLWSMQAGEPPIAWKGHYSRITSIEFSPDGLQLATGSVDRRISLRNAKTGELRDVLSTPVEPGNLTKMRLMVNSETGEPVLDFSPFSRNVSSLAYSPDGRWLAAGHLLGFMQLWDTISLEQGPILSGHTSSVTGISFSPDDRWITASSQDNTVMLWDALTNTPVTTLTGHNASVNCVAFSPDGHQIASGGNDRKLRLWEVGYSWSSLDPRYGGGAANLEYSPDGRLLLSYDQHDNFLKWDATTDASAPIHFEIVPEEEEGEFASISFARDGSQLAFGYDNGTIRLWNCQTITAGPLLEGHSDRINGLDVAWSPIIPMELVTGVSDGSVHVWRMSVDKDGNVATKLCTDGAVFAGAVEISPMYRELLTQRGVIELS